MARAMSYLLSVGHPLEHVWGYTIQQVFSFLTLAVSVRKERIAELSMAVRMAHHAEGKDYTQFLRSLEHD
ncbi:MAG: hypothetical protein E6Q97_33425 [Desulfurellales bacterium]|nr:MAG: hypothetical protein E6Q97_33425 [Desulfurellales bacterium]